MSKSAVFKSETLTETDPVFGASEAASLVAGDKSKLDAITADIIAAATGANNASAFNVFTTAADLAAADAHITSDGSDHTFIDQDVTSGSSPTFDAANITGVVTGSVEQVHMLVRAGTATIPAGQPVYISDYNPGGWYMVEIADASNPAKMPAVGITEVETPTNATTEVAVSGRVTGLNTSAYLQNASLFVAAGGGLTITKPTGTNLIQKVGEVARVHLSAGVIQVVGAGRTNDVPNIANGHVWKGDATGDAVPYDLDAALTAKLDKSGGTFTGLSEQQKTDHVVNGPGLTITLDYLDGCHTITCSTADAFTIAKGSNWPVTASGSQLFQVIADGVTVGAPTFTGWTTILASPDFSGITTLTGSGLYVIREIAGKTYIRKVVEV